MAQTASPPSACAATALLGSYTHITNSSRQVIRALHFDPWGNVKSDTNWTVFADREPGELANAFRFDRGFTGHEHYADLKDRPLLLPRQFRAGTRVHAELQPVLVLFEQPAAIHGKNVYR